MLAIAVGQTLTKYMDALLDPIFACGLSEPCTQALVDMAHYIPPAKSNIQEKLLDLLSNVLSGRPFSPVGSPTHNTINAPLPRDSKDPQVNEQRENEIILALTTLGSFDFTSSKVDPIFEFESAHERFINTFHEEFILNEFVRDVVIRYVEDDNPVIRRASALTSCQLMVKDPSVRQASRHAMRTVSTVIQRLLNVAVADSGTVIPNFCIQQPY